MLSMIVTALSTLGLIIGLGALFFLALFWVLSKIDDDN